MVWKNRNRLGSEIAGEIYQLLPLLNGFGLGIEVRHKLNTVYRLVSNRYIINDDVTAHELLKITELKWFLFFSLDKYILQKYLQKSSFSTRVGI